MLKRNSKPSKSAKQSKPSRSSRQSRKLKRRRLSRGLRIAVRLCRFAFRHRRWTVRLVKNAALGWTFSRSAWRLWNLGRKLRR